MGKSRGVFGKIFGKDPIAELEERAKKLRYALQMAKENVNEIAVKREKKERERDRIIRETKNAVLNGDSVGHKRGAKKIKNNQQILTLLSRHEQLVEDTINRAELELEKLDLFKPGGTLDATRLLGERMGDEKIKEAITEADATIKTLEDTNKAASIGQETSNREYEEYEDDALKGIMDAVEQAAKAESSGDVEKARECNAKILGLEDEQPMKEI